MLGSKVFIGAGAFLCQILSLVSASPLVSNEGKGGIITEFEDLPILVPDAGNIDGSILAQMGAEKFLSLWYIYVLSGKVVVSNEPWTLFVPLNKGLPADPSFLIDKEYTREILLNHVTLGDIIEVESVVAGAPPYYSLADTELNFSMEGDHFLVNGIRLTGDKIRTENGVIYAIEEVIPLLKPEFLQFVPLIEELGNPSYPSSDTIANDVDRKTPLQVSKTTSFVQPEDTTENSSFFAEEFFDSITEMPSEPYVEPLAEEPFSEEPLTDSAVTTHEPPNLTSRGTRFDKFRSRDSNKIQQSDGTRETTTMNPSPGTRIDSETEKIILEEIEADAELPMLSEVGLSQNSDGNTNYGSQFDEFAADVIAANATFLSSLVDQLNVANSVGAEFVHHFTDARLGQYLDPEKNYTAIIPTNDAFYDYYPIDWGFNPFLVENFTKDVLLNHILEGDIHLTEFHDDVEIQTTQGRIVKVSKDKNGTLLINGNIVPKETEVEFRNGRLYYIHQLLFVDYRRVNALREEYPFLETAPLLSFPWPSSPFLSHLLRRLQELPNTTIFTQLLRNSDIAHLVSSSDENLNRLSYSAFVPTDAALKESFQVEKLPLLKRKAVNAFLLEHIVPGYLFEEDFEDGFNLLSLTNKVIPIKIANGDIFVGPAKIYRPQQFVYNLGAIFIINEPFQKMSLNESVIVRPDKLNTEDFPDDKTTVTDANSEKTLKKQIESNSSLSSFPVTMQTPQITYEVRTEVSYSRQINNGQVIPVTKDEVERAKRGF